MLEKRLENERNDNIEREGSAFSARTYDGQADALHSALRRKKNLLQRLRNAQMHQIIMHNMMLKALPPMAMYPGGNPSQVTPLASHSGQDLHSAVRGGAVHHHHHYGSHVPPLPPIGYSFWPSLMPAGQGGNHQPTMQNMMGPVTLPPLNTVYSADCVTEYPEVKRARHDVIIRVVKKTFAGIAGLFRSRHHRKTEHEKRKGFTEVGRVAFMGIDDIHSNSLSSWIESEGMDKKIEMGLKNKERTAANVHHNPQALWKPDSGAMLYKGSQDKGREMRRSLKLVPPCNTHGLNARPAEMEHPSRTHKPCLTVEEALKESDREHYRKLVEMASEKYSKSKPLPFGRMKHQITTFSLDGHKANGHTSISRTTDMSRPAPVRALPNMSVWRDPLTQTKDRTIDVNWSTPASDVKEGALVNQTARKIPLDVDLSAEVEARLNLKEKETAAGPSLPSRSELITDTVRRGEEEFPRLTKEMQQEVSAALAQTDPNLVLCSAFKLRITQRDLATLQEGSWLNDEVINFYMNLVMSRSEQEVGGRKVYSFSTFLFPKLHNGGHAAVRRWTKAVDLFLYDIILVPLHLGVHWSLGVVDFKSKSVRSYDSMGQRHDDICDMILLYLKEEFRIKKGKDLDTSKWTLSSLRPSEMQQEVSAALAQTDPNLVLCSAFKLRITQRDLATLQEGSWLNDEVINFYMNLVMSRSEQEVGGRKVYSFSTFLFPKLHNGGHAAVRRWTKAVDLFLYDIILVPLHLGVHWSLGVVDFKSKSVRSYDSMGQRHDDICDMILLYLKEEFRIKKGKDLDTSKWTLSSLRPSEIPQQKNGSDCGVFVCKYADYISRGRNLTFRQNHMPYFRKAMIWEILNQKLLQ
ncbi:sentrin-specific protease 2-like protein [Labeo rohita]|uniref:Sentrin-specific protease 2-like protein n=1 Tax=Labeo rohita TaxID=84645 RepID=A0A498LP74_LABRO|nr:sentrin-specific protease 2-like protein [Labeo rohita]